MLSGEAFKSLVKGKTKCKTWTLVEIPRDTVSLNCANNSGSSFNWNLFLNIELGNIPLGTYTRQSKFPKVLDEI